MKIKLTDILNVMDSCKSIPELKIKCDLLYGEKFDIILDRLLDKMGYMIDQVTLSQMTLRDLKTYIELMGRNFEHKNRNYIYKDVDYNSDYYNKTTEAYYLPDCFKMENISINI